MIKHFKGKESQGIYIIPNNVNIDTQIGFGDDVHPNKATGDKQPADSLYY